MLWSLLLVCLLASLSPLSSASLLSPLSFFCVQARLSQKGSETLRLPHTGRILFNKHARPLSVLSLSLPFSHYLRSLIHPSPFSPSPYIHNILPLPHNHRLINTLPPHDRPCPGGGNPKTQPPPPPPPPLRFLPFLLLLLRPCPCPLLLPPSLPTQWSMNMKSWTPWDASLLTGCV